MMNKDSCEYFINSDYKYKNGDPVQWGNCTIDKAFCCLPNPCNDDQLENIKNGKRFNIAK